MGKGMTIAGMVIAVLLLVLFALDLIIKIPFSQAGGMLTDIIFILCAVGLGIISWTTFREQD